ncbi:hypothetical protein LOD99_15640 [Oopsacas minuta]|uniref:BZIP domain-containing protein n=1 Tax=Oopsacas minuta TaxID=111878 RepID=A0AAV7K9C6_9METZ|nr:hypothetical protein LOD99_15640 [Oopsacas minuta]
MIQNSDNTTVLKKTEIDTATTPGIDTGNKTSTPTRRRRKQKSFRETQIRRKMAMKLKRMNDRSFVLKENQRRLIVSRKQSELEKLKKLTIEYELKIKIFHSFQDVQTQLNTIFNSMVNIETNLRKAISPEESTFAEPQSLFIFNHNKLCEDSFGPFVYD